MTSDQTTEFDFHHADFTRCDDELCWYEAERSTVVVGHLRGLFQICQITFNRKNGGIYAQFTYFGGTDGGIAGVHTLEGKREDTVNLGEHGLVASSPVKYSHPPDGAAHFSQDGRVITKIRRQSFPLDGPEGFLFELHMYHPQKFKALFPGEEKKKRLYLPWLFTDRLPSAVTLSAEWRRIEGVRDQIGPDNRGPLLKLRRWRDGVEFKAMILRQPEGFPLRDHVLVLNVGPAKEISIDHHGMVFFGGWDDHDESKNPASGTGLLTFLYPAGARDELERLGRTMDLQPKSKG